MIGEDFPKSLLEFEKQFATEEMCRDHLFRIKYPEGFKCPDCGHKEFWWTRRQLMYCKGCGHQISLRVGTIMEASKKPLMLWYRAIFLVAFQKVGISAKNLQQQLGLGSYQTAWVWLHKIRLSMKKRDREPLKGRIEVDESYSGGKTEGKRGRGAENKSLLAVGVERGPGKKMGRIRIEKVADASGDSLGDFIKRNIQECSIIKTDGWKGYSFLSGSNYEHEVIKKKDENKLLPSIHLVISQFKRWTLGTHQGLVNNKHLQVYLDEFVFRFNRRKSKSRGKVIYRLLEQAIVYKATPYWKIIGRSAPNIPLELAA